MLATSLTAALDRLFKASLKRRSSRAIVETEFNFKYFDVAVVAAMPSTSSRCSHTLHGTIIRLSL